MFDITSQQSCYNLKNWLLELDLFVESNIPKPIVFINLIIINVSWLIRKILIRFEKVFKLKRDYNLLVKTQWHLLKIVH